MTDVKWTIKAREFVNCNCAYGCPCQFNALPTHGNCKAVAGMQIDTGPSRRHQARRPAIRRHLPLAGPDSRGQGRSRGRHRRAGDRSAARRRCCAFSPVRTPSPAPPSSRCSRPRSKNCTSRFSRRSTLTVDIDGRTGRLVVRRRHRGPRRADQESDHRRRISRAHRYSERVRIFARRNGPRLDQGATPDPVHARRFLCASSRTLHLCQSGIVR